MPGLPPAGAVDGAAATPAGADGTGDETAWAASAAGALAGAYVQAGARPADVQPARATMRITTTMKRDADERTTGSFG